MTVICRLCPSVEWTDKRVLFTDITTGDVAYQLSHVSEPLERFVHIYMASKYHIQLLRL